MHKDLMMLAICYTSAHFLIIHILNMDVCLCLIFYSKKVLKI